MGRIHVQHYLRPVREDLPLPELLADRFRFLLEADKVKHIIRQSVLFDGSRLENDAEHSWTLALAAYLFRDLSPEPVDLEKTVLMLLIHDLVEIDAGDTFLYAPNREEAAEKEAAAAQRIFGLLGERGAGYLDLWRDFEERRTPESRYAAALDRLEPLLQNFLNEGHTWKRHGVTAEKVLYRNKTVADGAPALWDWLQTLVPVAVERGYLRPAGGEEALETGLIPHDSPGLEELLALAEPDAARRGGWIAKAQFHAVRRGGELQAVLALGPNEGGVSEILALATHPTYQRQGHALRLLELAERAAASQGAGYLRVRTANSSFPALKLYQSRGFQLTQLEPGWFLQNGTVPIFEGGLECRDRLTLEKRLAL